MDVGHFIGGSIALSVLLGIVTLGLIIYAIVDLFSRTMDGAMRILWLLVILFFPILGSLIYLIAGRGTTRTTAV